MIELSNAIKYRLIQNKDTVVTTVHIPGLKLSSFIGTSNYRISESYNDFIRLPTYPAMILKIRDVMDTETPEYITSMVEIYLLTVSASALIDGKSRPRTQLSQFFHLLDYWLSEYDCDQNMLDFVKDDSNELIIGDKYSVASFNLDFYDNTGFNESLSEYQASIRWIAKMVRQ